MAGRLAAYTFTGEYMYNGDGPYTVTFDDNYSWNQLLFAINKNNFVYCMLVGEDVPKYFTLVSDDRSLDDCITLTSSDSASVKWVLNIWKEHQELRRINFALSNELDQRLNAYTITGTYAENDAGGYDVAFDSNYSWAKLVSAVNADKHVFCTLRNGAGNRVYMTLTESMLGDDSYVVFTANVEFTRTVWKMTVFSDGAVLYVER